MRLHIIGIPSAGKTTLATSVAQLLGVPHRDLDSLAFVDERWTLRGTAERDAMLARILEEQSFVTEGGFLQWTEPLFTAADHIVWLDPPLWVLIRRHLRRHWRTGRLLPSLLRFQVLMYLRPPGRGPARSDPDQTRAGIGNALTPWAHKVVRSTRAVNAHQLLAMLHQREKPQPI